jgi:predicted Zn-dependent protease
VLAAEVVENVDVPLSEGKEITTTAATAQITTGESLKAETYTEKAERSVSRPSLYREPREQLEHARRLAEVRKYWESEQILKDLISRKPPPPVFEEASVLMVDVLSNQNRIVEAQQFLDEAKLQFPSSDLVQQYRLGTPAPVQ